MDTPACIELSNQFVNLVPIAKEHAPAFAAIGGDASIWNYLGPEPFQNVSEAEKWIEFMLQRPGYAVTYSVFDAGTGSLAGSTSYLNVSEKNESLEIGFTWYGKQYQRTHINTATKLALFSHAFDVLHANRVQLQTDSRNVASQNAIVRLGALKEGVLRKNKKYPNGFIRDTVVFSVIKDEWPAVEKSLNIMLDA